MATVINNNSKKKKKGNNKPEKQSVTQVAENVAVIESIIATETEAPAVPETVVVDAVAVSEPIVVAHTSERNAVAATMSEDAAKNFIHDIMGMRDSLIASHNSGAVLPAGIADAFRQVADTLMSIEQEDAAKRGMSLNKEVYNTYVEPVYNPEECIELDTTLKRGVEYEKFIMPIVDQEYKKKGYESFPSETGRSLLMTIADNREYISDNEILYCQSKAVLKSSSAMTHSGLMLFRITPENEYNHHSFYLECDYIVEFYIPKSKVEELVTSNSHSIFVPYSVNDVAIDNNVDNEGIIHMTDLFDRPGSWGYAKSFSDICQLVKDDSVVVDSYIYASNQDKLDGAYPCARSIDNNVIVISNLYIA